MAEASPKPYELRVLKGANAGARMVLENSRLRLGSDKACDVVLRDDAVAPVHLQAVFADGVLSVLSNATQAGTHAVWLNGQKQSVFPFDVQRADVLQLGHSLLAIGQEDADWPNVDELQLAVLPQAGAQGANKLASNRQRRLLWRGTMGGAGLLGVVLVGLIWHSAQGVSNKALSAVNKHRSELDFALRTNAAYGAVRTHTSSAGLELVGLVGSMDDFMQLQTLAKAAAVEFRVENGQTIAQRLLDALRDTYPYLQADAELRTAQQLHISLKGVGDDKAALIAAAQKVLQQYVVAEDMLGIQVSAMLSSYAAVALHIQDALDEWPHFDTLSVARDGTDFVLRGQLLDSYVPRLRTTLAQAQASLVVPVVLRETMTIRPAPAGRLLGLDDDATRLRYARPGGSATWLAVGDAVSAGVQLRAITKERALLEIDGNAVAWVPPESPKRSIDIQLLHERLAKALAAMPVFAELDLRADTTRVHLRGGLTQSAMARLQDMIKQLTRQEGARHRILLDISEVPGPDGEVITIFDGATKAARLRRANGMERLVRIGESLGNGLTLLDIVDGTMRVQFGTIVTRLDVG